jgi:hypothetical protein
MSDELDPTCELQALAEQLVPTTGAWSWKPRSR